MVKKINDKRSIVKSTSALILLTIFVKLCGIIKQSVIAYYFGTKSEMDMYFIASDFVSEIGIVFFSALTINLINIYLEEKSKSWKNANAIFTDTTVTFGLLSIALSLLISMFPGQFAKILAPGANDGAISNLIMFLRLFCFVLACVAVSIICTAVLNAEKDFLPGKCVGLIQSASVVFFCILFHKKLGIFSLVIGTVVFFIAEDCYLLFRVRKYVWFCIPNVLRNGKIRELVKLWIPLFFSNSIIQLNAMIDKAIATSLGEGTVSALSYGHFVFASIHSIMIMSICTVLLTYFSSYVMDNKIDELITTFRKSFSLMVVIMIPITALCICESRNIVSILYGRGVFDNYSINLTNNALMGYATGIIFITIRDMIMQVLYALKKNKTAMINGIVGVVFNVVLSVILSRRIGIFGITVADSIAYLIVAIIGCVEIGYSVKGIWNNEFIKDIIPSLFFTISSIIPLLIIKRFLNTNIYVELMLESGCFTICFLLLLIVTKNDLLKGVVQFIKNKKFD